MAQLILRRAISLPFVILSITFITFIVGYLAPGDPILTMMGPRHDPEMYAHLRHVYGLDLPWYEQYVNYLNGLLHGDFGLSFRFEERTVLDLLGSGVSVSFTLGLAALVLSLVLGVPIGIFAALRQNSAFDRGSMGFMLALYSIPSFVLIPIFQWVNYQLYAHKLPSLPVAGWGTPQHWVLPLIVLAAANVGYLARLTRATMLEVLRQDFIRTAYAKGLKDRRVNWVHAFRNAMLPIVTRVGPSIAFLVTGAFVVENLFAIPGIGFVSIQAIARRDYPVMQGTTIILVVVVLIMNLVTDLVYVVLDPRVHVEG
jgi:ABC-type dipeptide/oligopeptide/nickel transport system permease component